MLTAIPIGLFDTLTSAAVRPECYRSAIEVSGVCSVTTPTDNDVKVAWCRRDLPVHAGIQQQSAIHGGQA